MTSKWAARILCAMLGFLAGSAITSHVFTKQVDAHNAELQSSMDGASAQNAKTLTIAQSVINAWQSRAQTCEAKFAVGTIVYQKQPLTSFPLLNGIAAFDISDGNTPKPSLYIPAQVDIYTDRQDVRYEWIDGHTGAPKAPVMLARSPSEVK
jgi:hypothetical protein